MPEWDSCTTVTHFHQVPDYHADPPIKPIGLHFLALLTDHRELSLRPYMWADGEAVMQ